MLKEKLLDYILDILIRFFGDKILLQINDKIALNLWTNAFESATKNLSIFGNGVGRELSTHRALLRYFYATFNNSNVSVSAENLSIAIAMELIHFDKNLDGKSIYDLSEAILFNWYNSLKKNSYFSSKYEEEIAAIQYEKNNCNYLKTMEILNCKTKIIKAFFQSYSHNNSHTQIRIWIPAPNETWIRWNEEHSLVINVNPMIGFELGFFRVGFDYTYLDEKINKNLVQASYSYTAQRECGEFDELRIGETTEKVIWAR